METQEVKLYFGADSTFPLDPIWPKKLETSLSKASKVEGKSYFSHDWKKKRELMESGYIVQPNDCPPIRNINSYGFEFFSAGDSRVVRHDRRLPRKTLVEHATNGFYTHSGDKCAVSDSGFLTSWLANSEYFKIITGIVIYCPVGFGVYQGPVPYHTIPQLSVLSAIEYGNSNGVFFIDGRKYFAVEMNLVCKLDTGELQLKKGQSLGAFFPVLNPSSFRLSLVPKLEKSPGAKR